MFREKQHVTVGTKFDLYPIYELD